MKIFCPNPECKAGILIERSMLEKVIRCRMCNKTITVKLQNNSEGSSQRKPDPAIQEKKTEALFKSILDNKICDIQSLIRFSPNLINTRDKKGHQALHVAAQKNHIEIIELLLASGAEINAIDLDNATPIHRAAFAGSFEATEFLIAKGAKINLKDSCGKTALDYAKSMNKTQIIALLKDQLN